MPYLVGLLTKGITSIVDKDQRGLTGKVANLFQSVEDATQENTLQGQFEEEMAGMVADTDDGEGRTYGSSAVMESQVETQVERTESRSFWSRIWDSLKEAASQYMEVRVKSSATLLSWVTPMIVHIVRYVLLRRECLGIRKSRAIPGRWRIEKEISRLRRAPLEMTMYTL